MFCSDQFNCDRLLASFLNKDDSFECVKLKELKSSAWGKVQELKHIGVSRNAVVDRVIDVTSDLKIDQDRVIEFVEPVRY